MNSIYIVLFMFVVFYVMVLRPQRKTQRAKKEMLSMLKKGDEIVTIGGLMGTIRKLGDDWVELEIANRTRVYVKRWAVGSLVSEEEEDEIEDEDDADVIDAESSEADVIEADASEADSADETFAESDQAQTEADATA